VSTRNQMAGHDVTSAEGRSSSEANRSGGPERWLVVVAMFVALAALPWLTTETRLISLAITTGINVIALYGLAILFGQAGILSVGHAALMGIGAYAAAILARDFGLGFWAALPICAFLSAATAGLLGFPALRVSGHHFVILTFAFGQLLTIVLTNGGEFTGRATGLDIGPIETTFGLDFNSLAGMYLLTLAFVAISMAAAHFIDISAYGRTLRSIRENPQLAASVGIDVRFHKIGVFMVSGLFAGVSGVVLAYYFRHISPSLFGAFPSVYLAMMVMLGGSRLLFGPLGGAIIVSFLPEILDLDPVEARIAYGAILVGVILILPGGVIAGIGIILRKLVAMARRIRGLRFASIESERNAEGG